MKNVDLYDIAPKLIGVVLLGTLLLLILIWAGVVRCGSFPYLCDVYYTVVGSPRVAIVSGDDGLGDPNALQTMLLNPEIVGAENVALIGIDQVTLGNLKNYKLVIVEHARKLSREQLEMFMQYVNQNGGRLVWIGDAGVEPTDDELERYNDLKGIIGSDTGDENLPAQTKNDLSEAMKTAWVRISENADSYSITDFGAFLGVRYAGNYCQLRGQARCSENLFTAGTLVPESTGNHPLIYGMAPSLIFKIRRDRDFSVVKSIPNSNTNLVLTLNFGGNIVAENKTNIGKAVPFIVTSGFGERVAYYAYPPEYMVQDNNAFLLIKRMTTGMLGQ
jgi:hypothetical protein